MSLHSSASPWFEEKGTRVISTQSDLWLVVQLALIVHRLVDPFLVRESLCVHAF